MICHASFERADAIRLFPRRKLRNEGDFPVHDARFPRRAREPVIIHREQLEALYHMKQHEAAGKLGISITSLKQACRKLNIMRWPYERGNNTNKSSWSSTKPSSKEPSLGEPFSWSSKEPSLGEAFICDVDEDVDFECSYQSAGSRTVGIRAHTMFLPETRSENAELETKRSARECTSGASESEDSTSQESDAEDLSWLVCNTGALRVQAYDDAAWWKHIHMQLATN